MCPGGCGFRIDEAWHSDMDGWYDEVHRYVCHACTARDGHERSFPVVSSSRDFTASPLPQFDLASTISAPAPKQAVPPRNPDATLEGGAL